ncbi:Leucine-rich repeat receptor-like serine/threonine-protein kinase [Thalictrum thalictroides]|uniref:Leucine-rich repeat receptor-like serine/threonine-protein kinase n=1 Tax=Thalictrum thalictroides TaxID=46969 RepID=A0A7J6WD22_THATH|nr:Leucine-rich repeat receptor-like serine/threonine-protein kinase [Thalictrum thalictroides]
MNQYLQLFSGESLVGLNGANKWAIAWGLLIDCGANTSSIIENRIWQADAAYIRTGTSKTLNASDLLPTLSTVRSFPLTKNPQKYCFNVPVFRKAKYLIRTTYFYGGINGLDLPPVFDQIVDGTIWSIVNTTEDYVKGYSSYYEGVFVAKGKTMSVCIGVNSYTDSDPFISALEFVILGDSIYNSTNFETHGLSLIARNSFGYLGSLIKYPDDPFDRYWQPFGDNNSIIQSTRNISVSGFWNLPPSKVFDTELASDEVAPMELQWPSVSLPNTIYYIALYFAEIRDLVVGESSIFNISLNGINYYHNLNVTPTGVSIFATRWPLSGVTKITLTPAAGSDVGPMINAGEIFNVLLLGGTTATRDVIALLKVKESFQNPPLDWNGDPCLPRQYSWTGVTCSEGPRIRVITLNMTSMGLSGSISDAIANLTALTDIFLGNNKLSGPIPDLSSLRRLQSLHLENNQFSGEIPRSLGTMVSLRELFIQNNNLTGQVPDSLTGNPGLNFTFSPGNHFSFPSP